MSPPFEDLVHLPLFRFAHLSLYSWLMFLSTTSLTVGTLGGFGEDGVTIIDGVEAGVPTTKIGGIGEIDGCITRLPTGVAGSKDPFCKGKG